MLGLATRRAWMGAFAGAALLCAGVAHSQTTHQDDFGVLVMAHGGGPAWNGAVEGMLAPLQAEYPLEIAFGMADAASMQAAVTRLEQRGVRKIAVVRLFISGESWYERTEQILGVRAGAPERDPNSHDGHSGHSMALWRIETVSQFAVSAEGLADAPEMGAVLAERARALSQAPQRESVLILAHGPEDDDENAQWLRLIDARADAVREALPFRRVVVETLREDWPEKRAASEARIRAFVQEAAQADGRAIVIPYRVSGFGPYARVLDGLEYASDGQGLIPSAAVEQWVRRQIQELRNGPFRQPAAATPAQHDHSGEH